MNKNTPLKLQSYKIDTSTLHKNLLQLNSKKSELQTTISNYRTNEDYYIEENSRLKQQIEMLQSKLISKNQHKTCNQKISMLEKSISQQEKQTKKYRQMYEIERKNHDGLNQYYEKKLELWKQDNVKLVDKYQQRISSLASEISLVKTTPHVQTQKSVAAINSKKTYGSKQSIPLNSYSVDDDSSSNNQMTKYQSPKKTATMNYLASEKQMIHSSKKPPLYKSDTKKSADYKTNNYLPPKTPSTQNKDYRTYNQIKDYPIENVEKNNWRDQQSVGAYTDQDFFEGSIRKLYYEIKQMGISAKQSLMLPQMKKMSSNKSPSRKDLLNFMKSAPISEDNTVNAEKNINYLEEAIRKKYGRVSGNFVTQLIISKVEEYQMAEKMNSEDISVSGLTPSLNRGDSFGMSSFSQEPSSQQDNENLYEKSKHRPSIGYTLKIDSDDNSMY